MKTSLDRVALANEILAKDVCDVNVLVTSVEAIQAAVRVFLEHREIHRVELVTIVVKRAEHSRAEVVVGKNEAAEVRDKWLNARAHGNEVVVGIDVGEFHFAKRF